MLSSHILCPSKQTQTQIPQLSHLLKISLLKTWYQVFLNNLTNQVPICLEAGKIHNGGVRRADHCLCLLVCTWDPLIPTRDSKMADGVKMLTKPEHEFEPLEPMWWKRTSSHNLFPDLHTCTARQHTHTYTHTKMKKNNITAVC